METINFVSEISSRMSEIDNKIMKMKFLSAKNALKTLKVVIIFLSIVTFATGCTRNNGDIDNPANSSLPAKDMLDISYGSNEQQKFDLYLPAGRSLQTTKVFIFIHGGGWTGGSKLDFNGAIPVLKKAYFPKYAIVNMNYVLANSFIGPKALPNQINDIQAVIDMIKSKAAEYEVRPEFVLCGHSAGAHLSMFYAYTKDNPDIKAVISLAGPTDFEDPVYASNIILGILFGNLVDPSVVPAGMSIGKYASPVTWIKSSSTPTIAFFGSTDTAVPVNQQKTRLDVKMAQFKVPYESYIWNGDHNAYGVDPQLADVLAKSKAFLNKYNL